MMVGIVFCVVLVYDVVVGVLLMFGVIFCSVMIGVVSCLLSCFCCCSYCGLSVMMMNISVSSMVIVCVKNS